VDDDKSCLIVEYEIVDVDVDVDEVDEKHDNACSEF